MNIKEALHGFAMWTINHVITHVPFWGLRKICYQLAGMKIGMGSRILLGTQFEGISHISIGAHTYINRNCHLDGRGGLVIGSNVNISNYSIIISASHDMKSDMFAYRSGGVRIDDYCWLGTRAIVLDNSHLHEGCVLSAGSVLKGQGDPGKVYVGVPAQQYKERCLSGRYDVVWKPWFA